MTSRSGGRALWRMAWREALAERRRHALIVGLVTLAVAVSVVVGVGARTGQVDPGEALAAEFGAASLKLQLFEDGVTYDRLAPDQQAEVDERLGGAIPTASADDVQAVFDEVLPDAEVVRFDERSLTIGDHGVQLLVGDPSHPLLDGLLVGDLDVALGAGDILASRGLLDLLDAEVGDVVHHEAFGTVSIVGEVAAPLQRSRPLAVGPRTGRNFAGRSALPTWYVGLGGGHPDASRMSQDILEAVERRVEPDAATAPSPGHLTPGANLSIQENTGDAGMLFVTSQQVSRFNAFATLLALVLLVQVGFVAAAAFATGTRRRVRELGVLSASAGATPRQIQGLVRRQAIVLGLLGGAAGVALGVVAVTLGLPLLEWYIDRPLDGVDIGVSDLVIPFTFALLATLFAAWLPARTVARVPATAALAGRVPLRRVGRLVTPTAIVLSLVGAAIVVVATQLQPAGSWGYVEQSQLYAQTRTFLGPDTGRLLRGVGVTVGVALLLGGGAALAGPVLQALARFAAGRRLHLRLAMRDSARQRTRSAATVAATLVVFTVPILVGVFAVGDARLDLERREASRSDVVVVTGPTYQGFPLAPSDEMVALAREQFGDVVGELRVPVVAQTVEREVALRTLPGEDIGDLARPDRFAWGSDAAGGTLYVGDVAVASPDVLALVGIDRTDAAVLLPQRSFGGQDVRPIADLDHAVVTTVPGIGLLGSPGTTPDRAPDADAAAPDVEVDLSVGGTEFGWSFPGLLVPPDVVADLDLAVNSGVVLLELSEPVQPAAWRAASEAARNAPVPFRLDAQPQTRGTSALLPVSIAVGVATLLAVIIGGLTAALAATESDRDLRTMAAVGADPRLRPRFRAQQVAYHTLVAAVLAVPVGLLLAAAARIATESPAPFVVPWLAIGGIVVVAPAVVAVPFRAFSRRGTPIGALRRPT